MKKPKSYNAVIIGERGSLFKICHVTQIIVNASPPPTPSFLHFTPPITPPPSEGIFLLFVTLLSTCLLLCVSALDFPPEMRG